VLKPGNHGTTFGGNPLACAAGNFVLHEIVDNGVMANARETGSYFIEQLVLMKAAIPDIIKVVRGKGLMIGVELAVAGKSVVDAMLDKNIIINCTHGNVLRFLPPLIAERKHIDEVCMKLREVFENTQVAAEVSH
jgi:acetylornithine/N-succinyldiaminopimelate aminotransferase